MRSACICSSFVGGVSVLRGGVDDADAEVGAECGAGAAGWGEAAVEGVAVLADAAGGEFGVFEGFAGFAVGHGFAGGAFAAGGVGGGDVAGDEDGFGAASGVAVALAAGEGVEEVLDEGVQGGGLVAAGGGAGEGGAADGEGGGDGGEDAVAAVAEGGAGACRWCSSRCAGRRTCLSVPCS